MPRAHNEGTAIARSILGTPANIAYKPDEHEKKIDKRIAYEDTTRVR